MLKLFLFALSIFLIAIIFVRVPLESTGLKAPSSSEKSLNILTTFGILLYVGLAVIANTMGN